jgi:hypothetical protein
VARLGIGLSPPLRSPYAPGSLEQGPPLGGEFDVVQEYGRMQPRVFGVGEYDQILGSVVIFHPVQVVDVIGRCESAAEYHFGHESVLRDVAVVVRVRVVRVVKQDVAVLMRPDATLPCVGSLPSTSTQMVARSVALWLADDVAAILPITVSDGSRSPAATHTQTRRVRRNPVRTARGARCFGFRSSRPVAVNESFVGARRLAAPTSTSGMHAPILACREEP